ncbi:MAG: sugar transferase [Anaerolineales bacterium]|nr:sugar transferase [Anaerolineales bacterium]
MADTVRHSLRLRQSEQRVILLVGDLIASIGAVFGALYVWREYNRYVLLAKGFTEKQIERIFPNSVEIPIWFYLLPLIWLLLMVELYEPHAAASWRRTLRGVAVAFFVGILGYSFIFTLNQDPNSLPRIGVGGFLIIASFLTLSWRGIYIRLYTSSGLMRRIFVVGAGKAGVTLAEVYRGLHPPPFSMVGFIDDDVHKIGKRYHGVRVLGQSKNLLKLTDEFRISNLVIAITGEIEGSTFQAILDAQERGVEVTRMPIIYEEIMGRVPIHHLESDWIIRSFVDQVHVSVVYELLKRLMDILGGLTGLIILAIIYPFAALATIIDSGLPILYSQPRLGMGGLVFKVYKFRTMRQDAESDGEARMAAEKDPRVTRVGSFLRRTRLDELPQFWTVLRGEMSLVGPRAERSELVAQFQKQIPFYRARLLVKPGLTGWAQINYGYVADVTETGVKLEYDLYYIKHRTISLDFQIVLRTVGTVLRAAGR